MGYLFDALQQNRQAPVSASDTVAPSDAAADPIPLPRAEPMGLDARSLRRMDERLVIWRDPAGAAAEEYRAIRTGLLARWHQRRQLCHVITSALPQEGKTITSLNLGASLGELPDRTCVIVEADLRRPQFRRLLGMERGPGLGDVLRGTAGLHEALTPIAGRQTWVLPAHGNEDASASRLLAGPELAALLAQLKGRFDHVVIDTPPVQVAADAVVLAAQGDEVILVGRMDRTPLPMIEQTMRSLALAQAKVSGVIATDAKADQRSYGYVYRYGSGASRLRRAA